MKGLTVGLVGGHGRMGLWFKTFFEQAGLAVLVSDLDTSLTNRELCRRARVVIVTVPIAVTEQVIAEVGPLVHPDGLLMDLTSIKTGPVKAMLAHSRCEVVGCHPLFGPREDSIKGRRVALCPGRGDTWLKKIKDFFSSQGADVRVTSCEHHDRLMSVVQGLTHLNTLALALAIQDSGLDPAELDAYATTSFRHIEPQLSRTLRQDADLIAPILMLNPEVGTTIASLEKQVQSLKQMVDLRDAAGCADKIRQARAFLGVPSEASEIRELQSARETGRTGPGK